MRKPAMRAVRVECALPSIEHDFRIRKALESVSWDFRGTLGIFDGNLRMMVECITTDSNCLAPGFEIGGIRVVEILEEWKSDYLTHHLMVLEFAAELIGQHFIGNDLCLLAGTNLTSSGLILQLSGRQSSMISFLNSVRGEMPVERVTAAKGMEGLVVRGPTLQQHRIIKVAHDSGWYEVPKKISIRDLATKLGLSKSSVAEQLVKAESEIVGGFLKRSK